MSSWEQNEDRMGEPSAGDFLLVDRAARLAVRLGSSQVTRAVPGSVVLVHVPCATADHLRRGEAIDRQNSMSGRKEGVRW
jgi:hypothetical protein